MKTKFIEDMDESELAKAVSREPCMSYVFEYLWLPTQFKLPIGLQNLGMLASCDMDEPRLTCVHLQATHAI